MGLADRRTGVWVAACLAGALGLVVWGPLETYSAGDLDRLRADYERVVAGCSGRAPLRDVPGAVRRVIQQARKAPDQHLPLYGGGSRPTPRRLLVLLHLHMDPRATQPPSRCRRMAALASDVRREIARP